MSKQYDWQIKHYMIVALAGGTSLQMTMADMYGSYRWQDPEPRQDYVKAIDEIRDLYECRMDEERVNLSAHNIIQCKKNLPRNLKFESVRSVSARVGEEMRNYLKEQGRDTIGVTIHMIESHLPSQEMMDNMTDFSFSLATTPQDILLAYGFATVNFNDHTHEVKKLGLASTNTNHPVYNKDWWVEAEEGDVFTMDFHDTGYGDEVHVAPVEKFFYVERVRKTYMDITEITENEMKELASGEMTHKEAQALKNLYEVDRIVTRLKRERFKNEWNWDFFRPQKPYHPKWDNPQVILPKS